MKTHDHEDSTRSNDPRYPRDTGFAVVAAIEGAIGEPAVLVETGETFEALAARTAPAHI
jgi:hypothetical protein